MYFVWVKDRFGNLNLINDYVPDFLAQGRVEVEGPVSQTDEFLNAGRHRQGVI